MRPSVIVLATLLWLCLPARPAHADRSGSDLKEACAASYEQAQTLRRAAKLTLARAQMVVCRKTCPGSLARDCQRWTDELDREMPLVMISATDRAGNPVAGAELSVDGEVRDIPPGGAALPLDPGTHRLVLRVGDERHGRELVLKPRDRAELSVTFVTVEPPPPNPPGDPRTDADRELVIPPAAWALGALGVVGLGTGAVLGIKGHVDRADLESRCAPNCRDDEVDAIERDWTIAAVAAAVGAVATGVAVWLVLDENDRTYVGATSSGTTTLGVLGGRF